MLPGTAADWEPSKKLRASSPQQGAYTCTLQSPAFFGILLACYKIHRRNRCEPPGE
jgi:hypothetical protein